MTIPYQFLSTDRTFLWRHIKSGTSCIGLYFFRIKIGIMALGAIIVGRQRIYFCNTGHSGYKRGTYRSSGAHQIAILIGFPYQFLSNNIHNGKSIFNDGIQLMFQPL